MCENKSRLIIAFVTSSHLLTGLRLEIKTYNKQPSRKSIARNSHGPHKVTPGSFSWTSAFENFWKMSTGKTANSLNLFPKVAFIRQTWVDYTTFEISEVAECLSKILPYSHHERNKPDSMASRTPTCFWRLSASGQAHGGRGTYWTLSAAQRSGANSGRVLKFTLAVAKSNCLLAYTASRPCLIPFIVDTRSVQTFLLRTHGRDQHKTDLVTTLRQAVARI